MYVTTLSTLNKKKIVSFRRIVIANFIEILIFYYQKSNFDLHIL